VAVAFALAVLALPPAAAGEPAGKSDRPAAESPCRRAEFRVVLDVGHTDESPGAISARGVPEHDFNLGLANRIEHALLSAGFARTVRAVTEGPTREGLNGRVARANGLQADVFLSIHHDSVPEQFLQPWAYAGVERRFSDRFKGHSIFVSNDNRDRAGSLLFARLLGLQLKARGLDYTPHYTYPEMGKRRRALVDANAGVYRFDRLMVLRATRMPAVLLEAGSIINREEEMLMVNPERQALVGAAVASAVEQFCAARAEQAIAERKRERMAHSAQARGRKARPASANSTGQTKRAQ
jgi:N-acetylmuramoyl-L-alanine amidase